MNDPDLLEAFRSMIPIPNDEIQCYFPYGNNRILIKLRTGYEIVFTFNSPFDWDVMAVERDEYIQKIFSNLRG